LPWKFRVKCGKHCLKLRLWKYLSYKTWTCGRDSKLKKREFRRKITEIQTPSWHGMEREIPRHLLFITESMALTLITQTMECGVLQYTSQSTLPTAAQITVIQSLDSHRHIKCSLPKLYLANLLNSTPTVLLKSHLWKATIQSATTQLQAIQTDLKSTWFMRISKHIRNS